MTSLDTLTKALAQLKPIVRKGDKRYLNLRRSNHLLELHAIANDCHAIATVPTFGLDGDVNVWVSYDVLVGAVKNEHRSGALSIQDDCLHLKTRSSSYCLTLLTHEALDVQLWETQTTLRGPARRITKLAAFPSRALGKPEHKLHNLCLEVAHDRLFAAAVDGWTSSTAALGKLSAAGDRRLSIASEFVACLRHFDEDVLVDICEGGVRLHQDPQALDYCFGLEYRFLADQPPHDGFDFLASGWNAIATIPAQKLKEALRYVSGVLNIVLDSSGARITDDNGGSVFLEQTGLADEVITVAKRNFIKLVPSTGDIELAIIRGTGRTTPDTLLVGHAHGYGSCVFA